MRNTTKLWLAALLLAMGGAAAAYPPRPDLERPPWMPSEQELIDEQCAMRETERRNSCLNFCYREGMFGAYKAGVCGVGGACTCTYYASQDLLR
ncbi:hypothetical protein [Arenimonas sp.]|uniref:hypothetical protein n=1 Tax=Arenimonas sp. TaxID=1872635 RepID=UPI0035B0737C